MEESNIVFQKVPREILTYLLNKNEGEYLSRLSMALVRSYTQIFDDVRALEKIGLVTTTKKGRRFVSLAERRKNIARILKKLEVNKKRKKMGNFSLKYLNIILEI
jgi:predicted transcriptional regulator